MNRSKYYLYLICLCISFLSVLELDTYVFSASVPLFKKHHQLLIVLSHKISSVQGIAFVYERKSEKDPWIQKQSPFPVSFGGKGLGYGPSLLPNSFLSSPSQQFPKKREGDLRSPIGIFEIKTAFGRHQRKGFIQSLKFPYLELSSQSYCVDDVQSPHYNQYVSSASLTSIKSSKKDASPSWLSAEDLYSTNVYDLGVWIDYNPQNIMFKGSCIFLHRWNFPLETTAGCTALNRSTLRKLVSWFNQDRSPLLVQMPVPLYNKINKQFDFPKIDYSEIKSQD